MATVSVEPPTLILVDDDAVNIQRAEEGGHQGIIVQADITQNDHLRALRAALGV